MDHPDRDRIIAKEMGWSWLEEALDEEKEEGEAVEQFEAEAQSESEAAGEQGFEIPDEMPDLQPDPATEGVDWVRDKHGHASHPLALRALEGSVALWRKCDELGLSNAEDEDLSNLIGEYQITSAKLAGALDGLAYGRDLREGAFIVAYLKRALGHLHATQAALENVTLKKTLPTDTLTSVRTELFAVREEILRLMREFRGEA
jgi:hypothetical protein